MLLSSFHLCGRNHFLLLYRHTFLVSLKHTETGAQTEIVFPQTIFSYCLLLCKDRQTHIVSMNHLFVTAPHMPIKNSSVRGASVFVAGKLAFQSCQYIGERTRDTRVYFCPTTCSTRDSLATIGISVMPVKCFRFR